MRDSFSAQDARLPALTEVQRLWRAARWVAPAPIAAALLIARPSVPGVAVTRLLMPAVLLVVAPLLVNLLTGPGAGADPARIPSAGQLAALVADALVVAGLVALCTVADPRSDTFVLLLLPQLQMSTTRRPALVVGTALAGTATLVAAGVLGARVHDAAPLWGVMGTRVALLAMVAVAMGAVARLLARHIRALRLLHRTVAHQALHDGLTGLPNRALFFERLRLTLARQQRSGSRFAVVFVDLDDLKIVNDTLGHAAGDELLRVTAARLRDELRVTDTPARLGGDEFAALLDGSGADNLEEVCLRLLQRLGQPISSPTLHLKVSVSIGVATSENITSAEELVARADTAMYRAKAGGKGRVVHFDIDNPGDVRELGH